MISIEKQINACLHLLNEILGQDLLGIYLYGSAIVGGLQKYSDLDLFVVSERATTDKEKEKLVNSLLHISGVYMKSTKLPIELTVVVKSEVNPWHYPPKFDFQYGEWLRHEFENGIIEPWPNKEMPDLALLITQLLLASKTIYGLTANQLLCSVPPHDLILATIEGMKNLQIELHSDTRNVLLTYARIWNRLETGNITCAKPDAALWAINRLPDEHQPVLERARSICIDEAKEHWDDIGHLIQPCADFMVDHINKKLIR